jgi:hypothetical protein
MDFRIRRRGRAELEFDDEMVRPTRFEPVASTFGGWRSIQLSYGRISHRLSLQREINTR